ncbi:S8 family peptidase [Sorangium sp. KYC3313]|uniref:S8 family peptidase n=1 Tax=Sorangium sp. KYC3313 TaxID=3449740 RepID=UPI003F88C731
MSTRYLILRANANIEKSVDLSSPAAWHRSRGGATQLSIAIESGREHDAGSLRADPKNAAVLDADAVFSLVRPTAQASLQATAIDGALKTSGTLKMPQGLIAVGAHATNFTGQGVRVAVLDTGIDRTHPAFAGKDITSRDFTGEGSSPEDVSDHDGHGTHCAGTICGASVDGIRVGVAPGVTKIAVGKVLGTNGGSLEMLLKGMLWAVFEQKADVVSMSLGYDLPGNVQRLIDRGMDARRASYAAMQLQNDIIKGVSKLRGFLESQAKNVVFVAATGNESDRAAGVVLGAGLPASELFGVGAVGPTDATGDKWKIADFSNGRALVVAPGVDVVSAAVDGGWATMSGTSMATPHVAGVAALWVHKLREAGMLNIPGTVEAELRKSTTRAPLVDNDLDAIGTGLIQAPAN